MVLQNLSTLAVGYGIAFAYDWRMALLITGILPLVILSTVIHMKFVMGSSSDSDKVGTHMGRHTNAWAPHTVGHGLQL